MAFLKTYQTNIMLFLSGICGILAFLAMQTKTLSPRRRRVLALLELSAMLLLISDYNAYAFRGDSSQMGYWMVRVSNFLVYFLKLYLCHAVTLYLYDLYENDAKLEKMPRRLIVCEALFSIGVVLLVVSQFTGLYYTFDAQNFYQRSPGNIIC